MTAEIAPSVARIGAMTPTLPTRKARPARTSPATLPTPAATIQPAFSASAAGTPARNRKGRVMTSPTSIAHATADHEPMTFTAREDSSELLAKKTAVARPNTMLITRVTLLTPARGLTAWSRFRGWSPMPAPSLPSRPT